MSPLLLPEILCLCYAITPRLSKPSLQSNRTYLSGRLAAPKSIIETSNLLEYSVVCFVYKSTCQRNVSPPSSGSKISRTRNQRQQVARRNKLSQSQNQSHIATESQSVCLGVEPRVGLMTRYSFLIESYSPVHMGHPLWREVGSVIAE
jgi:hypothetical protein